MKELDYLVTMIKNGGPRSPAELQQSVVMAHRVIEQVEALEIKAASANGISQEEYDQLKADLATVKSAETALQQALEETKKERTSLKRKVTNLEKKLED